MRKILIALFVTSLVLVGCGPGQVTDNVTNPKAPDVQPQPSPVPPTSARFMDSGGDDRDHNYSVITDSKTGCQYLLLEINVYNSTSVGGIAPLLDNNGKPVGCHGTTK